MEVISQSHGNQGATAFGRGTKIADSHQQKEPVQILSAADNAIVVAIRQETKRFEFGRKVKHLPSSDSVLLGRWKEAQDSHGACPKLRKGGPLTVRGFVENHL